jgi:tetratricopeptide (TPR) repeat protein/DNA-binding CsgD family transcriptional regulator
MTMHSAAQSPALSGRQAEIANMIVSGKSSREIAEALFLSPRTVENHIAAIFNKLGVSSRVELVTAILSSRAALSEDPVARKRTFFTTLPSPRNPYFTGREGSLQQVRDTLQQRHRVALSGLGGVGKTQAALEYAYRRGDAYDEVFWIRAETESTITTGFVEMAKLLEFPERTTTEEQVVAAVIRWLETHERWLLIADNADEPRLLRPFLPRVVNGHLLVTSRAQVFSVLGITNPIPIQELSHDEALQFLLNRTGHDEADPSERAAAQTLAHELGYLPLALEQAAAYIHENESRFADYIKGYRTRRLALLARGAPADDPAKSVTTTWQIAFDKLAAEPASADLLSASAFLSPDRIPLELVMGGAAELGPAIAQALPEVKDELALDELLAPLTRYSLIRREPESRSYGLHRLVQEVTRDAMDGATRRTWAERVVAAVNRAFPTVEYTTWARCERLLAHAQVAAQLIVEHELISEVAARLLNQTAYYLTERARYAEAEPLYQRSLTIRERVLGPEHSDVATSLNNLAVLYERQGRYAEAQPLYQRSLTISERVLGPDHPDVATCLNNLAGLYQWQGRCAEAEPLCQRSLTICEQVFGPEHPDVALSLNNLAELYREQGRYPEAEPLYQRSLMIRERVLGPEHPDVARGLTNLALLYRQQGRYAEAGPVYQRSLTIFERVFDAEHPAVAWGLNNLAELYHMQGRYAEAEQLYERSLTIWERTFGPEHPAVAWSLNKLPELYRQQGRYAEAEQLCQRSLTICERVLGPEHPIVAQSLNNLAELYRQQGRYAEAEPLCQRSLMIRERVLGPDHPDVAQSLNNLAELYRQQGRYAEAEPLCQRSLMIRERVLGPDHPDVAQSLNNLAELYRQQGRYAEAEPLCQRSLMIRERVLGPDHPDVAQSLNNLAELYRQQGRYAEAEPLCQRSLTIRERVLGPDHPDVAQSLNNLAELYRQHGRYTEAEPLCQRSLRILESVLGSEHSNSDLVMTRENLAALYDLMGRHAEAQTLR